MVVLLKVSSDNDINALKNAITCNFQWNHPKQSIDISTLNSKDLFQCMLSKIYTPIYKKIFLSVISHFQCETYEILKLRYIRLFLLSFSPSLSAITSSKHKFYYIKLR